MSDAPELEPGVVRVNRKLWMTDPRGALVPLEMVKEADRTQDTAVRHLVAAAEAMALVIQEFKEKAFSDVDALQALLGEKYQARVGGAKGNITLTSFDGLMKVQVQVADHKSYGPELQTAKALIDECIEEWSGDSRAEIRALVMNAFNAEKEGQINRGALQGLLRLNITDDRWLRAMQAIRDAEKIIGSKRFIRFSTRPTSKSAWSTIVLDVATA